MRRGLTLVAGGAAFMAAVAIACDDGDGAITVSRAGGPDASLSTDVSNEVDAAPFRDASTADVDASPIVDAGVLPAPTFDPPFGVNVDYVTLTAPGGGEIYYTLDGSMPDKGRRLYAGPVALSRDQNAIVRAIAIAGTRASEVATAYYTIYYPSVPTSPVIRPPDDTYDASVDMTFRVYTPGPFSICYTLNGDAPTCNFWTGDAQAPEYPCTLSAILYDGGAVTVMGDAGTRVTVKALSCSKSGSNSEISVTTYTF